MIKTQLFSGKVRHRRFYSKPNAFTYSLFMFYIELSDPKTALAKLPFVSYEKFNWFSFRRRHYLTDPTQSLEQNARQIVKQKTGVLPQGKIFLLTHLSCMGYCFNPISVYFIFHENSQELAYLIVEVTNTPWGEKHQYVLDNPERPTPDIYYYTFKKEMHVSPFLEMNYEYLFRIKINHEQIILHLENYRDKVKHFDATLSLHAIPAQDSPIRSFLRFPLMTQKVVAAIYWQALKLWFKGVPIYTHPKKKD